MSGGVVGPVVSPRLSSAGGRRMGPANHAPPSPLINPACQATAVQGKCLRLLLVTLTDGRSSDVVTEVEGRSCEGRRVTSGPKSANRLAARLKKFPANSLLGPRDKDEGKLREAIAARSREELLMEKDRRGEGEGLALEQGA
ncbi:hypothetical protein SKAU_G00143440 [Synaphobranchus kaupii]|uniref:Uncharacterized protein n=1 Tax=Synaphobranchus kaupii TaxID=118154 RepID=A0A9Q1FTS7_SYNKA|nr:hypothetical protein SKAU_G00143440 [Synaphobranchus kaupii]